MPKIIVTSSCYIAVPGKAGRTYADDEIVEASDELAREFFIHGRARRLSAEEIATLEKPAEPPPEVAPAPVVAAPVAEDRKQNPRGKK